MTTTNSSPPSPKREPKMRLSRDEVLTTAMAMIDDEGLESLSMRRLADRLGVYPASVYWHAGTKAQLLAMLCHSALGQVELPAYPAETWQEWIILLGRSVRRTFRAHPNLVVYFTGQIQVSMPSLLLTEQMLTVLKDAGFSGESLIHAYNTTISSIFGWLNGEFAAAPPDAAEGWEDYFRAQLKATDEAALPVIRHHLELLENRAFMVRWESGRVRPMDGSFEFMLATMVAGLEAMAVRASAIAHEG